MLLINNIRMNNKYKNFMKKLSKGKNIDEDLKNFMNKVYEVEKTNV